MENKIKQEMVEEEEAELTDEVIAQKKSVVTNGNISRKGRKTEKEIKKISGKDKEDSEKGVDASGSEAEYTDRGEGNHWCFGQKRK